MKLQCRFNGLFTIFTVNCVYLLDLNEDEKQITACFGNGRHIYAEADSETALEVFSDLNVEGFTTKILDFYDMDDDDDLDEEDDLGK